MDAHPPDEPVHVTVVMDLPEDEGHRSPTVAALGHAARAAGLGERLRLRPVTTDAVGDDLVDGSGRDVLGDGVLVGPGSPYRRPEAALAVIRGARERGVPLVGT